MNTRYGRIGLVLLILVTALVALFQVKGVPGGNATASTTATTGAYPIVDTGQGTCYDDAAAIACPAEGEAFYGQDAQVAGNAPSYTDNDGLSASSGQAGTVTDNVTGLMWSQSPDLNGDGTIGIEDKLTYEEALAGAETFALGGYDDWRLPTIKELYS